MSPVRGVQRICAGARGAPDRALGRRTATRIVRACESIPAYVVVIILTGSSRMRLCSLASVPRESANSEPVTPYQV